MLNVLCMRLGAQLTFPTFYTLDEDSVVTYCFFFFLFFLFCLLNKIFQFNMYSMYIVHYLFCFFFRYLHRNFFLRKEFHPVRIKPRSILRGCFKYLKYFFFFLLWLRNGFKLVSYCVHILLGRDILVKEICY